MATTKPRISVTLDKHHHRILALVAGQQGRSISALVGELVEAVAPSYERLSVLLAEAQQGNEEVLTGVVSAVERAEDLISEHLSPMNRQIQLFRKEEELKLREEIQPKLLNKQAKLFKRSPTLAKRSAALAATSDPRPVNTGVRSVSGQPITRGRRVSK